MAASPGIQGPLPFTQGSRGGRPLDSVTRDFFEPRLGADLSDVRIHTDAATDQAARRIHALAFTVGSNVGFRHGYYAPATSAGRHLLAHELAHVQQQAHVPPRIRRQADDDFKVTQLQDKPEERTQGMADRFFFEFDRADFRSDVPAEAAEKARLDTWAAAHAGQHVRLVGRASQEGDPNYNRNLAQRRALTVRNALVAGGVVVDAIQADMTYTQRPVDYRFYRSVEVVVPGAGDSGCDAFTPAQQTQDVADCESAFTAAHTRALAIANAGIARLRSATDPAATPAPDRDAVLNSRFPSIGRSTLLPRFESVVRRLGEVGQAAGHVCNHRCAPGCERAASAGAARPLQICAPFYIVGFRGTTISADERVFVVMHETTHSAVVPGSDPPESIGIDLAYANTRLFTALTGSEALGNTDSYVITLLTLARSTSGAPAVLAARGVPPADTMGLTTPAGETGDRNRTARRALGFAEAWLNYASFWTPALYDFVAASLIAWKADHLGRLGHVMLECYCPLFQLEHPGTDGIQPDARSTVVTFQTEVVGRGFPTPATSARARVQDRTRVAGVYDRLSRMLDAMDPALSVDRAATGDGSWSSAPGLPGLGTDVRFADSFFSLAPSLQVRHVIRLMARGMADVGTSQVEAYVEAADAVHRLRGLGP